MKPGIRITQDCADPCRGTSTQEPVKSKKCIEAWLRPAIHVVGGLLRQAISSRRRGDVRGNARFAHDMTNFRLDVRGKRFNTHVTGKIPVPPLTQNASLIFRKSLSREKPKSPTRNLISGGRDNIHAGTNRKKHLRRIASACFS